MQYIPALDTPENNGLAERAIKHYQHVLDSDAVHNDKINSAKGIAYLYLNMKEFEDSKKYYRMVSDLDPKDPEPHYYIGVIDWTMCYKPRMEERAKLGVQARRGSESDRSRSEEGLRRAEGQEHAHP
jgi:tetratricopeptide (TPR) repeat protein